MDFVHLHTHSHFSLLDGLPKIDELVARAQENKMKALALTDHGVMYGVVEFFQKAKEAGIKPIVGVEFYIARNGRKMKRPKIDERPYHLVLLAKNKEGYQNLIKLTTLAHLEGFYYKPRIDLEILKQYSSGLIALSACLRGEIPQAIINNNLKKAEEICLIYQKLFGSGNFYLEVQPHPNLQYQDQVNEQIFHLSKKLNIPVVATNDIHYILPEDAEAQDVLLCIQTKKKKEDKERISMLEEDYSFKTAEEMVSSFQDYPEVIENTNRITKNCNFEMEFNKITLPHFPLPKNQTPDDYLRKLCQQGIERRYKKPPSKIKERLEYELEVIKKTGFAPYFLIVQDFVNWAKENSIVVGPGRGSAAGSIVAYLTNITNIDPLKYELLFERFLNPERITMPDIDMDFADARRDEVIEYVENKYGFDHVAQIITFGTMAARAAVRDAGRVLGLSYNYCDQVAKLIPPLLDLKTALEKVPELHDLYEGDLDAKKLIDTAQKLEGVARHASTHACGVVITKEPLEQYLPIQFVSQDDQTKISQYSLHPIEDLGLLKMDFLGLKNLTILEDTIEIIEKTKNIKIKIDDISLNDKKTFNLLQKAKTTGVFQLESSGMKRYLKELKPNSLEDIIAMVALFRPGPMEWIPDFIARKQGRKNISYPHPKLKPILEKTYGVAIYQEQIMQIARDLAGFTLAEADVLRKAVGKKIRRLLKKQRNKFIEGCQSNEVNQKTAEDIFDFIIEPFAGYGFNRAHAACYALIAYQTAFLKANFPAQFMASLLTSDQNDTDRIAIEVDECQQMGLKVLPPEINESFSTFTVVKESLKDAPRIRFGLAAIKNVGHHIVKRIIHERKTSGPYKNLEDFLSRVQDKDLNKKSLESLIKCGALDKFGERAQMLFNVEQLLKYARGASREATNGQTNLFRMLPVTNAPSIRLKSCQPASKKQKLNWEKELLGLYISEHPLEEYQDYLKNLTTPCIQLRKFSPTHSQRVKVGGVITQIQRVLTRSNQPMLFVKVEDTSGEIEVLVFSTSLKTNPQIWQEGKLVLIEGKLSSKKGEAKILCDQVKELNLVLEEKRNSLINQNSSLKENHQSSSEVVYISIPLSADKNLFNQLKKVLEQYPGEYKVNLKITSDQVTKIIKTNFCVDRNQKTKEAIEVLTGRDSFEVNKC